MAELFDKNIRTVNEHINNIFKEGELALANSIRFADQHWRTRRELRWQEIRTAERLRCITP